jgi:hypothetical protein
MKEKQLAAKKKIFLVSKASRLAVVLTLSLIQIASGALS